MNGLAASAAASQRLHDSDRRAFIKNAALLGAFAVPFVTSFSTGRGLRFGVGRASAYDSPGNSGNNDNPVSGSPGNQASERAREVRPEANNDRGNAGSARQTED